MTKRHLTSLGYVHFILLLLNYGEERMRL